MYYIAHRDEESNREQAIFEHLSGTACLAGEFAMVFNAEKQARFCAMLHDVGKYSAKFQNRIRGAKERVDHSTAGAKLAAQNKDTMSAICIAGHHGGLPDFGDRSNTVYDSTLYGRIKRREGVEIENYSAYKDEIEIPEIEIPFEIQKENDSSFFFTHMLFSCLVDADWLDTEAFYKGASRAVNYEPLEALFQKLSAYVEGWWETTSELNSKRCQILRAALEIGASAPGLFSFTAPTGAGKTVASVAFALSHLVENSQKRIIYVIPYVSILEQTKSVFEKIFGSDNVVAHYANIDFGDDETDPHRLAAENWDAPIILTTAVQFFESLFSNKPSQCRKLHNIANSTIIMDEAQMLPVPYLTPCTWAITQLVKNYRCSVVLCTATQPALDTLLKKYMPTEKVREICPDIDGMHVFFKRVKYEYAGRLSYETLSTSLNAREQVLFIVNSRKLAHTLFALLKTEGGFCLTTLMTPEHRRKTLDEIRERLKTGKLCRVVATSLVEAGVDVDFPAVYKELAGLDSIIQAAGRCNREGKRSPEESVVTIFESESKSPPIFDLNIAAAKSVMHNCKDIASAETVKEYFQLLYNTIIGEKRLDVKDIMKDINGGGMPFATVAGNFKLIENEQSTIYIPIGEGGELVRDLRENGPSRNLLRKLGQYAVNVYPDHFKELYYAGAIETISLNTAILSDIELYKANTGLVLKIDTGLADFI